MDNEEDGILHFNLPKRNKTKRKKDTLKYNKTCAIYGIFDCDCCQKHDTNMDYSRVIDETINQPSTSGIAINEAEPEQNSNEDDIDVGTDCLAAPTDDSNNRLETNESKVPDDIMNYINSVYKESGYTSEEESEVDIFNEVIKSEEPDEASAHNVTLDATSAMTLESLPINNVINETIANATIKSEILPVTEEEEEEIDVVNIPTDETPLSENNPTVTVQENEIKTECSDDENQIIDIINFDDTDCRENLVNNLATNTDNINMDSASISNEDEIIDVENLVDDSPSPQHNNNHTIKRRKIKRRLMPQIIRVAKRSRLIHSVVTIDLINTNDSIIEITDSPVVPRKITEVINVDDDDEDENEADSELNTTASPHRAGLGNCPVCLQSLAKKEIMSTICGHVYCARCIKNVIKTTKKCPNCRKNLTLKSIHPLFI